MNYKQQNAQQRIRCVKYMKAKKDYCHGKFTQKTLIAQKDKVRAAMPAGKYFGHTPQVFLDELKMIDLCLENWDEYITYLN